ncbi:NTP transferase domain-containing protein [Altererythrobacter sp. SALINAS58]|uniref:NTP transferase domain-containing protein n=1 Tax=Alteripontixanthobacter muriae TaxID=2705546 RepID=UPI0015776A0D|nr:NTP transferase domain-containing protein [Alteripontixanthobacter muriae]NTZ43101.1 NTP transferase domain-containing protein [Alteripontixanthobacter muriae]
MRDNFLAVVLAAGRASRFGGGKLDATCAGKPVGAHVLSAIGDAGIAPGIIIIPEETPTFAAAASEWEKVVNERAQSGLGSSLALAAQIASARGFPALLVVLADMPLLSPGFLMKLIVSVPPAATRYPPDRPGVPALLPASLYPDLLELAGDHGATALLAGRNDLTLVEPPPDMLIDVDTQDDLARAARLLRSREGGR